jgi:hypothetical protein
VRRWTFRVWIGVTIAAAAYVMIAAPLVTYVNSNKWIVGAFMPALMILLLGLGLAWLVWQVFVRRRPPAHLRQ